MFARASRAPSAVSPQTYCRATHVREAERGTAVRGAQQLHSSDVSDTHLFAARVEDGREIGQSLHHAQTRRGDGARVAARIDGDV